MPRFHARDVRMHHAPDRREPHIHPVAVMPIMFFDTLPLVLYGFRGTRETGPAQKISTGMPTGTRS